MYYKSLNNIFCKKKLVTYNIIFEANTVKNIKNSVLWNQVAYVNKIHVENVIHIDILILI